MPFMSVAQEIPVKTEPSMPAPPRRNGRWSGYSHLLSMTVKNNEHVTKGQVIAKVGQTGVIDRPQLHFEVRYTPSTDIAKPIDPNLVLPQ